MKYTGVYIFRYLVILTLAFKINAYKTNTDINSIERFTTNFLKQARTTYNRIFSPIMLQNALATATLGSEGSTNNELHIAAQLTGRKKTYAAKIKKQNLKTLRSYYYYVSENVALNPEYRNLISFHKINDNVDFADTHKVGHVINATLFKYTKGIVRRFGKNGPKFQTNKDTLSLELNTAKFEAKWKKPFQKSFPNGKKTPWLHVNGIHLYGQVKRLDATALVLEFANCDYFMMILIPNEGVSLVRLEEKLQKVNITQIPSRLIKESVNIYLRSKKQHTQNLVTKKALRGLGIKEAFKKSANFTFMYKDGEKSYLKDVFQYSELDFTANKVKFTTITGLIMQSVADYSEHESEELELQDTVESDEAKGHKLPPVYIEKNFFFFIMNDKYVLQAGSYK